MKLLPALLLSLGVAVATVAVYDLVRRGPEAGADPVSEVAVDLSSIEDRLAALEAERQPMLRPSGIDPRTVKELEELDRRLAALEATREESAAPDEASTSDEPFAAGVPESGDEPDPEAVARFRKLRSAALREERKKRVRQKVDDALGKLDISLSDRQKGQILDAYVSFDERFREIWGEAKTRGAAEGPDADWQEIFTTTNAAIQREFSERISDVVPWRDAEQISAGLYGPSGK